ncbi:MAG TPA: cyclic nucleotide-binding domain-containing protein [Polyangiaceae bacterium]|nr:cyclic nucleotide-binding domain-containing protein [Polyangiaceae bacterium]
MQNEVRFSALTDVGKKRDHNEDNFLVDKKLGLFVVCDGMGGHAAGEVASAIAVRTFHEEIKKGRDLIDDYAARKTGSEKVNARDIQHMLEFAINRASSRVHAEAERDTGKRGMGTTLVALLIVGNQAFLTYVGDSRIYMLRDGMLQQMTEDHTVYNELIKRKKMSREKVEKLAQKNAITRAVGVYEHAEPDSLMVDLLAGDRFLLCTDGLYQYFENDLETMGRHVMDPDMDAGIKLLVDGANQAGGSDNITGVIVTVGDAKERDEDRAKRLQLKRDILARMPLFRPLNDRELLRVLQVTDVTTYRPGQFVMREGERGEELFIVLSGQLKVMRGETELARLSPGDHVGEMALVRSQPRSASVVSASDSDLMVIRRTEFFEILRKEHQLAVKLLWQFLGVLAERLAETNRELGQAREELAAEDISDALFEVVEDEEEDRKTLVLPPPPEGNEGLEKI